MNLTLVYGIHSYLQAREGLLVGINVNQMNGMSQFHTRTNFQSHDAGIVTLGHQQKCFSVNLLETELSNIKISQYGYQL